MEENKTLDLNEIVKIESLPKIFEQLDVLGELVDEKMIEPIYEHWIELIEIETNKSYVYKLVDGVLLSPIDYEEEVKNLIEKHID